jgi:hypothetical protein
LMFDTQSRKISAKQIMKTFLSIENYAHNFHSEKLC